MTAADGSVGARSSSAPGASPTLLILSVAAIALTWGASATYHVFDAGELVAAAAQLGAGHPPGQPLHALLGYAATLVPLGPIAWRVALLSVAAGLWAAHEASSIVADAARRMDGGPGVRWVSAATALGVLVAPPIPPQLSRPEVYTLALALTLAGARRLIAWACRDPRSGASLRTGALLAGLAVAVHPPHALALLAIGGVSLAGWRRDALRAPRAIGWAALACVVGLGALAYLPARAAAGARTWGDPTTASGLLAYLSGRAYAGNLGARTGDWTAVVLEPLGYVLVSAGIGVALALAARRARGHGARLGPLAAAAAAATLAALLQPHELGNPDNVAYAAPAAALLLALGGAAIASALGPDGAGRRWLAAAPALVLAPLVTTDLSSALRADPTHLETAAFALVDAPAPRALVVARSDFVAATWMQARDVDGARPDVALLVEGLATSSWHWRTLAGHPRYDGTPVRGAPGPGHAPWVRGAIARALGHVAIFAEHDDPVGGRGTVVGAYLALPARAGDSVPVREPRAFAERTAGAAARAMRYGPGWYADLARGVVREIELTRAERLFLRDRAALAIDALRRASAPLPPSATEAADGVAGPPRRRPAPAVRDPEGIFATDEDAVRALSVLLVALGEPARATALLEGQAARGDDRALLQLAWIQAEDGIVEPARAALAAYRARHPEREAEIAALEARLR